MCLKMINGSKLNATRLYGLKDYVAMVMKKRLFSCNSSIISKKRTLLSILLTPFLTLILNYKILLLELLTLHLDI
jgi:hypothetical protein